MIPTETLADRCKVPLYTINCACLGTEPDILEARLGEVLRSAANWKVVLLLDDATSFLQDEYPSHGGLNALNSAFRFQLARSNALVFMTAVESRTPDRRFLSHISVALRLQELSSRPICHRDAWASAIRSLTAAGEPNSDPDFNIMVDSVLELEHAKNMDGRQIYACVRAALALAKQKDVAMTDTHIQEVIRLADEFKKFKKSFNSSTRPGPASFIPVDRQGNEQNAQ